MTVYTVIAVGYSNVSVPQVKGLLRKESNKLGSFEIFHLPTPHEEARPYELGKAEALAMAVEMSARYHAPLCIGIVCVRFQSPNPVFQSGKLDIAMLVERGSIKEKEVQLNPACCKRETLKLKPNEFAFAHEASYQLLELIRVHQRSLLLEHF